MNKIITLCILSILLCKTSFAVRTDVYPKSNSLQKAINNAVAGDTLYIHKGIFNEYNILVNKRLVLMGENYPVFDGQRKYEIFTVTADSVVIKGLQVQNTGTSSLIDMAAIRIKQADYVCIIDNKLLNNTYGVYVQNSNYTAIMSNKLLSHSHDEQNAGNGIHAWKASHLYIKGNVINGHRDGIYFEFVTESKVISNVSEKNVRYGLHFMFSNNDEYARNIFSDNGSGVAVMFSKGVTMFNNTFRHNWGDAAYGLLLKEISDGRIEGNIFEKNTVGIYMEGANRIYTRRNTFKENGWAMRIQASCSDGTFEENNFISNSFDVATNGTMVMSFFNNNYWDKYDGYDMDKNRVGDVPYYPVSMYSVVTERIPSAMILYRSFLTDIMNQVEKLMPSITPDHLKDDNPMMKSWKLR